MPDQFPLLGSAPASGNPMNHTVMSFSEKLLANNVLPEIKVKNHPKPETYADTTQTAVTKPRTSTHERYECCN
jgi:hypothetical protein